MHFITRAVLHQHSISVSVCLSVTSQSSTEMAKYNRVAHQLKFSDAKDLGEFLWAPNAGGVS